VRLHWTPWHTSLPSAILDCADELLKLFRQRTIRQMAVPLQCTDYFSLINNKAPRTAPVRKFDRPMRPWTFEAFLSENGISVTTLWDCSIFPPNLNFLPFVLAWWAGVRTACKERKTDGQTDGRRHSIIRPYKERCATLNVITIC